MFDGLSLTVILPIISTLGLPGLVLIFWYVDHRRYEDEKQLQAERDARRTAQHQAEITAMREQFASLATIHEKRFESVVRMYEDNVLLVKGWERVAGDLSNIIHVSTQVSTRLVEKIENNMNCPVIRDGGLKKWALTAKG